MDIRVNIVCMSDGQYHAWSPAYPRRWLAAAASCHEACRKAQDAVVSFYDILLGLPRDAIWIRLPEADKSPGGWARDLLVVMGPGEKKVTFRVKPPGRTRAAGVAGDFTSWHQVPMRKLDDGSYAFTVRLPQGVYGYQYVVDGVWMNDPANDELATPETVPAVA
ncbi:MAG: hypothetical protein ACE15C_05470 [Phycisphaerae bacterium]